MAKVCLKLILTDKHLSVKQLLVLEAIENRGEEDVLILAKLQEPLASLKYTFIITYFTFDLTYLTHVKFMKYAHILFDQLITSHKFNAH